MQLSLRLAARPLRPLRLLPPLASATSGRRRRSATSYLIKAWLPAPPRPGSAPPRLRARKVSLPQGLAPKRVGYFRTVEESVWSGDYGCFRKHPK